MSNLPPHLKGPQTFASRKLFVVWWAHIVTPVALFFALLIFKTGEPPLPTVDQVKIVTMMGLLCLVLAMFLPEIMLFTRVRRHQGNLEEKDYVKNFYRYLNFRGLMVTTASLIGFVLAIRVGINAYFPFGGAALFAMLIVRPTEQKIIGKIQQYLKS